MSFTFRYCVSYVFLILLVFKADPSGAQPSLLGRRITANYPELPVPSVLQKLSKETGIRFSYDPEVVPGSRKVTLRVTNQPLSDVMRIVFDDHLMLFKEMGNQLVIYRDNPKEIPAKQNDAAKPFVPEKPAPVPVNKEKQEYRLVPDTVIITKTDTLLITRTDTLVKTKWIVRHDTIIHTDTVYIEKPRPTQKAGRNNDPRFDRNSLKNQKFRQNNGFYAGISYGQLIGDASFAASSSQNITLAELMKNASGSSSKYSVGAVAGFDYNRFGLQSGLNYTRLGESFEYSFTQQEGGFYKTDTVEKYYTLTGIDTSWYYITDSSWVNIDYKEFTYKNPNTYRYLEIPLLVKFRFFQGERAEFYALGGIISGFYLGSKALLIQQDAGHPVTWTNSSMMNPFQFSWQAGAGTAFSLSGRMHIFAELAYRKSLNDSYKEMPFQKKINLLNLKTGIFVRL